jgi:hypothetical protein
VEEIKGAQGELIDRLIALLTSDALGEGMWYNVGRYAEVFVGGEALSRVEPDTGRDPTPGSVGEMMRREHLVVSREQWFEMIRDRLRDLVESGMDEAFLVRSIRDGIRPLLDPEIGEVDRNRAKAREHMERMLEDPVELAAFRARLVKDDPSSEKLSDEEVSARLRRMAENKLLRPMSAEDARDAWATLANWDGQVALLLPDRSFDEWYRLMATRGWKQ